MDHQEKLQKERKIWEKRVIEFDSSEVTVAEFAKAHGFSVHQFYYWKNKFLKAKSLPDISPSPTVKLNKLVKVITAPEKVSNLPDPIWLAKFLTALYEIH